MFFEKWFDPGDLVMYVPNEKFVAYDRFMNPYEQSHVQTNQVGIFLGYPCEDNFDSCRVFLSSKQKSVVVPQRELRLLSKKR